jgi:DNA-binding HxlR family transcriptional regulator
MKKKISELSKCPITRTLDLIGGKWTFSIIYVLMNGTKRFKDLERSIDGINTRMLVKELKTLEQNGILTRTVYAEVPPKVEYSLTDKGRALKGVLHELKSWGKAFVEL